MPLYEYKCESCEHRFERIRKFSDPPLESCPQCAGPVKKLLSSPAIQFKGSGFYITDYAKKSGTPAGESKSGDSASGGDKSGDGGSKADAKTESKSEKTETKTKTESSAKPE